MHSLAPKPRTAFFLLFLLLVLPVCIVPLLPSVLSAQAEKPPPKYVIKLAAVSPEGTSWADTGYKFKKYVEEKSQGQIQVTWYLGGIMGDEPDEFLKIRLGQLQGGGFTHLGLGIMVPETRIQPGRYMINSPTIYIPPGSWRKRSLSSKNIAPGSVHPSAKIQGYGPGGSARGVGTLRLARARCPRPFRDPSGARARQTPALPRPGFSAPFRSPSPRK